MCYIKREVMEVVEKLVNKKVEIESKSIGTGTFQASTYKGIVKAIWQLEHCAFIELDSGVLINVLYVANIKIVD